MPDDPPRVIPIIISSTCADLGQYREEASEIIAAINERRNRVQLKDVSMERQTQSGDGEFAVKVSRDYVNQAEWMILIVGWHYGTISDEPGANGLSVTEWEYQEYEKRKAADPRMKLFVFMPGELNTENQYTPAPEEKNIALWMGMQTQQGSDRLRQFKQTVSAACIDYFANLPSFRKKLQITLERAIEKELFLSNVTPGSPLADVVFTVLDEIDECVQRVSLIGDCKRIHDQLHELRHLVVLPLREDVLPQWQEHGTLTRRRTLDGCAKKKIAVCAKLEDIEIDPSLQALFDSVQAVLGRPDPWQEQEDLTHVSEALDDFMFVVEQAFDEADLSMQKGESDLGEHYAALLHAIGSARGRPDLSAADQQRLDEKLRQIDDNRKLLKQFLSSHHNWHQAYKRLKEVADVRNSPVFARKLKLYLEVQLNKLLQLAVQELDDLKANSSSGQPISAESSLEAVSQTSSTPGAFAGFPDDLKCLKDSLESLLQGAREEAFDKVQSRFETAFYYVDKRTLQEVEEARRRATDLNKLVRDLAKRGERRKV